MSDMDDHELCDMCGYRESDPISWFEDDGKTFDDPDTIEEDGEHLTMTYHDTCEFCEHGYSYTVYARVHTIEFESEREVI